MGDADKRYNKNCAEDGHAKETKTTSEERNSPRMDIQSVLSSEFQTAPAIIGRIVSLIDEGNTIPFIARYRKEMTGAMDKE